MSEQELAQTIVAADLFGSEGLREDAVPPAPDKYEIVRYLGRGGSGAVFLAQDTHLGRPVALKYMSDAGPADLERLFREARLAARLNNPSIIQVYEVGEVEGLPFIAMQYIPGGSLATADLDVPTTLQVIRQVAAALAHAHSEGIVHRDIKPENILLDADRRAVLTDFGIARDLRGESGTTISHDGQILGTPGLMAPEQARGETHTVDARSDVYALGATLYVKVTGHAPFSADNLVELLHAVIHDVPPFPRRYRVDVPRDVEALILRCMSKRQDERFSSMNEVIAAIDQCLTGQAGAGLSASWFTSFVRSRVDEAPGVAPEAAEPERDWLPALEIAQEIATWDTQLYRVSGDLMRYFPRLDALIARLDLVLAEHPATGWARFYRGVAWFRRGDLRRALEDMERSIDRVRDLAGAYFELGRLYLATYLDQHHSAHEHLSRVGTEDQLRRAHSRLDQARIAFAEAQRLKKDLPGWQMGYADAVRHLADADFEGCVIRCDAILAEDPDLEEVWRLKGYALRRGGQNPLPAYQRALEIRRSCHEALVAMAEVHLAAGQPTVARECLAQALEIHSGLVPAQVMTARTYLPQAGATASTDDLRAGLEQAEQVFERNPDRYDAGITAAELQVRMGRASGNATLIATAFDTLDRAEGLEGCTNRVHYLRALAHLAQAELVAAAGGDPRADLEAILALRDGEAARVPDNRPWLELFAEAQKVQRVGQTS